MKIFYDNLIDYAGVVITPSSADSLLPAKNIVNEQIKKVWRTGNTIATETITFDLLSAKAVAAGIIAGHNLTSSDTVIELRSSTDNFAANDVLRGTFTWNAAPMLVTLASVSVRYWRCKFTKSAAGQTRDIGRLFLGTYDDWGDFDYDAFQEETVDPSPTQKSVGGQSYSDIREKYLSLKFSWPHMTDATRILVQNAVNKVGKATPLFIEQELGSRANLPVYVKLRDIPKPKFAALDGLTYWSVSAAFDEQI